MCNVFWVSVGGTGTDPCQPMQHHGLYSCIDEVDVDTLKPKPEALNPKPGRRGVLATAEEGILDDSSRLTATPLQLMKAPVAIPASLRGTSLPAGSMDAGAARWLMAGTLEGARYLPPYGEQRLLAHTWCTEALILGRALLPPSVLHAFGNSSRGGGRLAETCCIIKERGACSVLLLHVAALCCLLLCSVVVCWLLDVAWCALFGVVVVGGCSPAWSGRYWCISAWGKDFADATKPAPRHPNTSSHEIPKRP